MAVHGILFDMDGVLADSEEFIAEAAKLMFQRTHGVTVQLSDFLPFVGAGEDKYLGGVAALYGVVPDLMRDKAKTYEIYGELIQGRLKPLPGAVAFVRAARARGLKTALATSADRPKMVSTLAAIGLAEDDFDATVNGLDVARKKPFPDIFLEAARRVGLAPSDCLVVEDAVNGVKAALTAGCRCLALATTFPESDLRAAGATRIVANLAHADLEALLAT
jgi:HAD superfamily hydrolase (TIGR01509 family)